MILSMKQLCFSSVVRWSERLGFYWVGGVLKQNTIQMPKGLSQNEQAHRMVIKL